MDNEASAAVTTWLTNNNIQYQTVAPGAGGHRANRAERSIQTGVNHFLSTIATTDADFPIRAWCYTIEQMKITANMLRPTNINPKSQPSQSYTANGRTTCTQFYLLDGDHSYSKIQQIDANTLTMASRDM